jgi:hypothetical protein
VRPPPTAACVCVRVCIQWQVVELPFIAVRRIIPTSHNGGATAWLSSPSTRLTHSCMPSARTHPPTASMPRSAAARSRTLQRGSKERRKPSSNMGDLSEGGSDDAWEWGGGVDEVD